MNLDRLATTIEHDRRAAHQERSRAASSSQQSPVEPAVPPFPGPPEPSR